MSDLANDMQEMMASVIETEREIVYVYNMAAELLVGRLRSNHIGFDTLCDLKSELKSYDAKECKWKQ